MFTLPENIMEIYEPKRNFLAIHNMEPHIKQRFDKWVPYPEITLEEAQQFIEQQFGMRKFQPKDIRTSYAIPANLQYVCSYEFDSVEDWKPWALENEIEAFELSTSFRRQWIEKRQKELAQQAVPDPVTQAGLQFDLDTYYEEVHTLLHLYTLDGVHFHEIYRAGSPFPKVIDFSLQHLLGKAPIPEEMYSNWPHYLQFLMDIAYI